MTRYGLSDQEWGALEHEVLDLFTALLRVDTTNPPGHETACAKLIQDYLAASGVASELLGELPDRQNLAARLPGARPGPRLVLMGHTDVVPADAAEWSVPPFGGVVKDGYVWGCGATDMKNQVAAEAVAVARLARSGADFAGELVYLATADEEVGDHCGVRWLCEHRPAVIRCDYLLNEGMGGLWLPIDGRKVFLLAIGEKAFAQFQIRTRGNGGHGSVPEKEHSAVLDLAKAVLALGLADPPAAVSPTTERFIDAVVPDAELASRLKDPQTARVAARDLRALDLDLAALVEPLYGATFTPTILSAGTVVNVIPTHAEAAVDCRITPEMTAEETQELVASVLRSPRHRLGVRVDRQDRAEPVVALQPSARQHRTRAAARRAGGRARADVLGELHGLALGARHVPRLRRLRLRPVPGRELPCDGGRPRPLAGRAHLRRGRHLSGALLRTPRPRPARVRTAR